MFLFFVTDILQDITRCFLSVFILSFLPTQQTFPAGETRVSCEENTGLNLFPLLTDGRNKHRVFQKKKNLIALTIAVAPMFPFRTNFSRRVYNCTHFDIVFSVYLHMTILNTQTTKDI